jgi:hypothetical protein
MAFGKEKAPLLLHPTKRINPALRFGGMGVASETGLGKELAQHQGITAF